MDKKLISALRNVQKPARYIGGEVGSVKKDPASAGFSIAFCFPDLYEVGMSHLGGKILYNLYNNHPKMRCERVFMPDFDMLKEMRERGIGLFSLESGQSVGEFDFVAFTLQYEMSYTTILAMLSLSGIPLLADERADSFPIVIAGGPCACNPEPLADFFDLFILGEGEEVNLELAELFLEVGRNKREYLSRAAKIQGVYVPSLYSVEYFEDGRIKGVTASGGAPETVEKRIVKDFNRAFFPEQFIVPFISVVHDRAMLEVLRGCIRGCRFCQAGFIYRPFRERSPDVLNNQAKALCSSTGFDEISLTSLSTSDLSKLEELLGSLVDWTSEKRINLSLPSLRLDAFSPEILDKIDDVKKSGLTFAPEAGSQRLRDVINKNITEEEIFASCRTAFLSGYTAVKLYFMIGLPTETDEDIKAIAELAQAIVDLYYSMPERPRGKSVNVTVSVSNFVPKPFTPFWYEPQDTADTLRAKLTLLRGFIKTRKVSVKWHNAGVSYIEAALARGDRRMGAVIRRVYEAGAVLEGWEENFSLERWEKAFLEEGLSGGFYACRKREYGEIPPWGHLSFGVSEGFLQSEHKKALEGAVTKNCREGCSGCGANRLLGGECF